MTLGGEAKLLSGLLDEAESDLAAAARAHRSIGATAGEALSIQRLAEVAFYRHRPSDADFLLEEALAVARESYLGHHLLDRIYGAMVRVRSDPEGALGDGEGGGERHQGPGRDMSRMQDHVRCPGGDRRGSSRRPGAGRTICRDC